MSKLFMYGTSLEGIEQLMVMVPNFQLKRSGKVINNYFNFEGGAKDCNGNVINVNKGTVLMKGAIYNPYMDMILLTIITNNNQ